MYGTLWNNSIFLFYFQSYVAPEVLQEKPYDKSVDIWTIGIITFLLVNGCLPFDDEHSEKEIARQTIHEPTPFPNSLFKSLSPEVKDFIDSKILLTFRVITKRSCKKIKN